MRRADNLTTFMCRLSSNLGSSTSWNPQGLSRPVRRLLYILSFAPSDWRLRSPQGQFGLGGEEKNVMSLLEFSSSIACCIASSLYWQMAYPFQGWVYTLYSGVHEWVGWLRICCSVRGVHKGFVVQFVVCTRDLLFSSWCAQGIFVFSEVCRLALGSAHPPVSIDRRVY